jgi:hypothetical protein
MKQKKYSVVRETPVAKFLYKGNHSHPVQRTVLVIESNSKYLKGYELREGKTRRDFTNAPVKTYRKEKIATIKQCRKEVRAKVKKGLNSTTLQRVGLTDLLQNGI